MTGQHAEPSPLLLQFSHPEPRQQPVDRRADCDWNRPTAVFRRPGGSAR